MLREVVECDLVKMPLRAGAGQAAGARGCAADPRVEGRLRGAQGPGADSAAPESSSAPFRASEKSVCMAHHHEPQCMHPCSG